MHDVSASVVKLFDSEVKQQYQEVGGKIRPHIYTKTGVVGLKVGMPVYGMGFAKDAPTGGKDVETMGSSTTEVEITLAKKQASEYSNIFEEDEINFDDRNELAMVIAKALGRTEDQSVLDALTGYTFPTANVIAVDFEESGIETSLTVSKVIEASVLMEDAGVDEEGRFFVAPAKAMRGLMNDVKATSNDFTGENALVNGRINYYCGFKFIWIGDTTDVATGDLYGCDNNGKTSRSCYAFHKQAVGMAVGNLDKGSKIDYVAQKTSYLVLSPLRVGAAVRDATGIIQVKINTAGPVEAIEEAKTSKS